MIEYSRPVLGRALVTIDGFDGSGKSTLAARLGARGAAVLSVDAFRRPVDWARGDRPEAAIYYDERYDLPLLETCARAFLSGQTVLRHPTFDGAREAPGPWAELPVAGAPLLVIEGVFIQRLASARSALGIYLDVSPEVATQRIVVRDMAKGRTRAEVERRIRERYEPAGVRYRRECQPRERAAIVVDNDDAAAPRVLRVDRAAVQASVAGAVVLETLGVAP